MEDSEIKSRDKRKCIKLLKKGFQKQKAIQR